MLLGRLLLLLLLRHPHLGLPLLHAHTLLGHAHLGPLHASELLLEALLRYAAHLGLLVAPNHALLGHALRGVLLLLL